MFRQSALDGRASVQPAARPPRVLVAESEPPDARQRRRKSVGRSSGESFAETLEQIAPGLQILRVSPVEGDADLPSGTSLDAFDAVFLTGSPLHLYEDTPPVRRQVAFMRAVFEAGTPAFGSCAGLQVATVAAGGAVRPCAKGREAGFARRISSTDAGRDHPLLAGRPAAYDALAIHTDEVETLPPGALHLATSEACTVQAAEIRMGKEGLFWGVQYHPELDLEQIAMAMVRDADEIVGEGLASTTGEVERYAGDFRLLHEDPSLCPVAWRIGADRQVLDPVLRRTELTNFFQRCVLPRMAERR
jgi:GMP synthase (glutamine-hydrolysing)